MPRRSKSPAKATTAKKGGASRSKSRSKSSAKKKSASASRSRSKSKTRETSKSKGKSRSKSKEVTKSKPTKSRSPSLKGTKKKTKVSAKKKKKEIAELEQTLAEKCDVLRAQLQAERRGMKLVTQPLTVLRLFGGVTTDFVASTAQGALNSPWTRFVLVPFGLALFVARSVDGPWSAGVAELELNFRFITWWFGLGVLSSIGLGTGFHSGMLFLFPHIFLVVRAARDCGTTDFETRTNMWANANSPLVACPGGRIGSASDVTFLSLFWKVWAPCFLWGSGTALGEIPPFLFSRAAALAGEKDEDFEELASEGSGYDAIDALKQWTMRFLKTHGFVGVIALAAWPNAAFDMCGICCGHFLMPFWEFLTAVWIGKALMKVNFQAIFFIKLFADPEPVLAFFTSVVDAVGITKVVKEPIAPVKKFIEKMKNIATGGRVEESQGSLLAVLPGLVTTALVMYFAYSCVEQLARARKKEEDERAVKAIEEELKEALK